MYTSRFRVKNTRISSVIKRQFVKIHLRLPLQHHYTISIFGERSFLPPKPKPNRCERSLQHFLPHSRLILAHPNLLKLSILKVFFLKSYFFNKYRNAELAVASFHSTRLFPA